ncbi:MAG: superoxide dismutase [Simkaniaceae bacterium]|nr:superoxide dismutase [Simkaniaceae bacterium]
MYQQHDLPSLPYDFGALEPAISGKIMELHHQKHHAAYVKNLNDALEKHADAEAKGDVAKMIALQSAIKFNGGGHVNHSIFWTNLAPQSEGGGTPPTGQIGDAINKKFGSFDEFKENFNAKAGPIQGSGWCWLGYHKERGQICIRTCSNQDPLSTTGLIPLLGIDVWEHAYYLQYENRRPEYLKNIWTVINWNNVEERFINAQK